MEEPAEAKEGNAEAQGQSGSEGVPSVDWSQSRDEEEAAAGLLPLSSPSPPPHHQDSDPVAAAAGDDAPNSDGGSGRSTPANEGGPARLTSKDFHVWGKLFPFYFGTFWSQFANNALQVCQPLVVLDLTDQPDFVAYALMVFGVLNAMGSTFGGFLYPRMGPNAVLVIVSFLRAFTLGGVALTYWLAEELWWLVLTLYSLDALLIGINDTARQSLPKSAVGQRKSKHEEMRLLDLTNANFQGFFDAGTTAGPLVLGIVMMQNIDLQQVNIFPAAGFVATGISYMFMPLVPGKLARKKRKSGLKPACKHICSRKPLILAFIAFTLLQVYRLKSLISALMTTQLFENDKFTAWMVMAFGVGGMLGSFLFGCINSRSKKKKGELSEKEARAPPRSHKANAGYMFLGATGLLLLAGLWIPVRYLPHIDPSWQFAIVVVAIIFFMILNVFARLAMTSLMLFEVSEIHNASVMGLRQTFVKISASGLRAILGIAFTATSNNAMEAFIIFSLVLVSFAVLQYVFSCLFLSTHREAIADDAKVALRTQPSTISVGE